MYGYIGWNQLTPAQQQKVPAEYKNREVPLSVIQQNKIEITEMQKSVFNGSYSQRDETTYKVSDSGSGTKTSKFADFCKKAFAGAGAGVIAGLLASIIFPVGGAIACGIIAGGAAYLYASKKCKEANQKAAQQAAQQAAQNQQNLTDYTIPATPDTPDTPKVEQKKESEPAKTTPEKEIKTSSSGTSAADKKTAAKAAQAKYGVTREVQAMWEDAFKTALEEAKASGDSAKIKKAQADLDKFYKDNPGYVGSKNGSQPKTKTETKQASITSSDAVDKKDSAFTSEQEKMIKVCSDGSIKRDESEKAEKKATEEKVAAQQESQTEILTPEQEKINAWSDASKKRHESEKKKNLTQLQFQI